MMDVCKVYYQSIDLPIGSLTKSLKRRLIILGHTNNAKIEGLRFYLCARRFRGGLQEQSG